MAELDFEYYRDTFFADPTAQVDRRFVDSTTHLLHALVGLDDSESAGETSDELMQFTHTLAQRMKGSRHFNERSMAQLHPNGNMPAELAHFASTLRNNNTIVGESSPVESENEVDVIKWLLQEIARYDEHGSGSITTGGTLANLTGLMVAREKLVNEQHWDGRSEVAVFASSMSHYSVSKAARLLAPAGLIRVVDVPLEDGGYRMDPKALHEGIKAAGKRYQKVMAIVAVAGETETGLVDPLADIAEIAENSGSYFHIDGAYGAPFVLSRQSELFSGMERSNSLAVDPHKYLYTPYPGGSVLFADSGDHSYIEDSNKGGERYVLGKSELSLGKRRIEGSMGGHGAAAALAVIETLGTEGLKFILDHTIDLTDHGYRRIVDSNFFTPAYEPELNSLCFFSKDKRVASNDNGKEQAEITEEARAMLEEKTGTYLTTTTIPSPDKAESRKPIRVFRFVPTHPFTEIKHVDEAIDDLHEVWDQVVTARSRS